MILRFDEKTKKETFCNIINKYLIWIVLFNCWEKKRIVVLLFNDSMGENKL